ncbi:MAG: hypothetical protein A3G41_05930 [Elusimicrobia bacterium RIFCSPLOWO2_12_FULL_59_9]|nr:MAG: hypothetical protein A3G41_05930 [Elusimicrobia bacterium RIFCSPLOWO2_12_FULL_59_9]
MNAAPHNPRLVQLVQEIKRVCVPAPETNHRKRDRQLFVQRYIMQQEDKLYSILRGADVDEDSFRILTAAAQHFMREGEIERFRSQSAFEESWAYRKPRKAAAQIHDDMGYAQRECARLVVDMQSFLSKGPRSGAANAARAIINLEGAIGIRIAGLIELAGFDTAQSARLAAIIQLVDGKALLEPQS